MVLQIPVVSRSTGYFETTSTRDIHRLTHPWQKLNRLCTSALIPDFPRNNATAAAVSLLLCNEIYPHRLHDRLRAGLVLVIHCSSQPGTKVSKALTSAKTLRAYNPAYTRSHPLKLGCFESGYSIDVLILQNPVKTFFYTFSKFPEI